MMLNQESMQSNYHIPVMLQETVAGLVTNPDGCYVDCTFGGGGHSRSILRRLSDAGRLFAFDQDADARQNLPDDPRITFVPENFRHLERFLRLYNVSAVDGILADLGISSHQIDVPERGFSTRFDAPLDMRMDRRQTTDAATLIAQLDEKALHRLFEQYGEVTNARTLARVIAAQRKQRPIKTVFQFREAVHSAVVGNPNKYFAQVFQALRMQVNDELGALKSMMEQAGRCLKPSGRIAVITFHSIEDRIVKQLIKGNMEENEIITDLFGNKSESIFKSITRKPILPTPDEIRNNPRSRSAKLRIAEKKVDVHA
jgi:16S rRNA (cytosine1402-N4)-methyltransferase